MNAADLKAIIENPAASAEDRAAAIRELKALEPKSPTTNEEERAVYLCGPLGLDLLHFAGAHELIEVTWRDLVRFADSREWPGKWENHDLQQLWRGWIIFVGWEISPSYERQIWSAIREEFATDQERRAEFERIDQSYPLFGLSAGDDPCELEMYERHLSSSDRKNILAIAQRKLDETLEYWFRTREVAQRIIEKLTERK